MTNSLLAHEYLEAVGVSTPESRGASLYLDAAAVGTPVAQAANLYLEVLAPNQPVFIGWGVPL